MQEAKPTEDKAARWLAKPKGDTLFSLPEEQRLPVLKGLLNTKSLLAAQIIQSLVLEERGKLLVQGLTTAELADVVSEISKGKTKKRWWKLNWNNWRVKWRTLRSIGSNPLFKVSYLALATIPIISKIITYFNLESEYLFFAALYFGSLFFAFGNLIYDLFCPIVIKRFESPNDLYDKMLDITAKQKIHYPEDEWNGSYEHSVSAYNKFNLSKPFFCHLSALLYFIGIVLLVYVVFERSWLVVNLLLKNLNINLTFPW